LHVRTEQMACRLDAGTAFAAWEKSLDLQSLENNGCLLRYSTDDATLDVDFNFGVESVYDELLGLEDLGFSPSFRVTLLCTKSHHFFAMATSLTAAVKQYNALYSSIRYESTLL
jgi:hypothetical protein